MEEPKQLIDSQIKAFEGKEKEEKNNRILDIFKEEVGDREIDFFVIFNPKWLNKTYPEKDIREEIQTACFHYDTNMPILEQLPDYSAEAIQRYKETMDMSKAINESLRLKDEEEKRKARALADEIDDGRNWKRIAVFADKKQMDLLHEYLNNVNIPHRRVY